MTAPRAIVWAAWYPFSVPLEGSCNWLYLDNKGLPTTAIGCLCPLDLAITLVWLHNSDSLPAAQWEIEEEWRAINNLQGMRKAGGGAFRKHTTLYLSEASIQRLVKARFDTNENILSARYENWEEWPSDAIMACHSMAWAVGAAYHHKFPHLEKALIARDFSTAAVECHIQTEDNPLTAADESNPGVIARNAANKLMFENAARVVFAGSDCNFLHFPNRFTASTLPPGGPFAAFPSNLTEAVEESITAHGRKPPEE